MSAELAQELDALTDRLDLLADQVTDALAEERTAVWSSEAPPAKRRRRFWTEWEDAYMRSRYPHDRTDAVAAALNRSVPAIYGRADKLGLHKTDEYLASPAACRLRRGDDVGKATRFRKGHIPHNKGVEGWDAGGRSSETQFQPGERHGVAAERYMPVGSVREVAGYLYRKVAELQGVPWTRNWRLLHHLVWEEVHDRPLPEDHIIVFRDGDAQNVELDNLELITRAELMHRNSIHNYPAPVRDAIRALSKLESGIEDLKERTS